MSRFVQLELDAWTLAEVRAALDAAGVACRHDPIDRMMLAGGLECAGEPVDLHVTAGALGSAADFGFVLEPGGRATLVCADVDRELLDRELVPMLRRGIAQARVERAAVDLGGTTRASVEPDGTRRIVIIRRS